ncbi:MAG: GNAT family N-acetyltransferase [Asgard group archaeon]|nr:GNAT family N-acetyltransferase [Asgard group archaeon]
MSKLTIITGKKQELPKKYLEQMPYLIKDNALERMPKYNIPNIAYYKNEWFLPNLPGHEELQVLALEDKKLIGYGYIHWNSKYDNLTKASFSIYIMPEKRRLGYGTEILGKIVSLIPPQIEVITVGVGENSIGEVFIRKYKKETSFTEIYSVANLVEFNKQEVFNFAASERERVSKLGYEFIEFENFGYLEKLNAEKYVKMVEEIWNDMPAEELTFEKEILTVERYNNMIDSIIKKGEKVIGFVVIEKETQTPIGVTKVFINKYQPEVAAQDDTGIIRNHRGKGLGLAIKYQILEKMLKETKVEYWLTSNAQSNEHMLRINKLLKHQEDSRKNIYEFSREEFNLITK